MFVKNWKTTLAGIGGLLGVFVKLAGNGWKFDMEDFAVISGSLGLIFAKDKNVTGGTVAQATPLSVEAEKRTLENQK